jgi:thioredoxin
MNIVKFSSPSCAPCKMLAPILDEISKTHNIPVESIDVEAEPKKAMAYGVRSVPTLVFEHNGNRITTLVGMQPRKAILEALGITE